MKSWVAYLDQLDVEIDEARLKRNGWPKPDVKCQGRLAAGQRIDGQASLEER